MCQQKRIVDKNKEKADMHIAQQSRQVSVKGEE